jgi:ABC-type amino acid transport substrate-binding protein
MFLLMLNISHAQQALTIGTSAQNPPFASLADKNGNFSGFDIDIMSEVCNQLKVTCKFEPILFNDLFPELLAHKIDLAIAAIIITPYRQEQFLFSIPYLASNAQFMTTSQSAITTSKDIINKRVGTRLGTPFKALALSIFSNYIKSVDYPEVDVLVDGLNNKASDIVLIDAVSAKSYFANNSSKYKLVGAPIPVGYGYGIMANRDQAKLVGQVNQVLRHMIIDGSYLRIYKHYFPEN